MIWSSYGRQQMKKSFKKINTKIVLYAIGAFIFVNLLLLINNNSFLISEKHVKTIQFKGMQPSTLSSNMQYFDCKYWTGRSVISVRYYVSAVRQCPFMYKLDR